MEGYNTASNFRGGGIYDTFRPLSLLRISNSNGDSRKWIVVECLRLKKYEEEMTDLAVMNGLRASKK
jgi:hypothetical protein